MTRGDRCAILAANSPRWAAAYLGMMSAGAVAVPLDTAFTADQVAKLLLDSGSSLLFTDQKHLETARQALALTMTLTTTINDARLRLVLLDGATEGLAAMEAMLAQGPGDFVPVESQPEELAMLLYTSGTTSDPKGVMLTHANLHAEAEAVFQVLVVNERDAILGVLPLFHALAQMANLMLPYSAGTKVVYLEQLNTTELLRGLRERDITLFCCVPQFFYLIHDKVMKQVKQSSALRRMAFRALLKTSAIGRSFGVNLGKLFFGKAHEALGTKMRYLITGGSRFDVAIGRDLEALGFDILQAYGLTECCGGASLSSPGERFNGSVGHPLPTVEVRLEEHTAATEESGAEVCIRGGIVMKGYYRRPDATAEVLRDGWLYTGDLGRFDQQGNLHITGRKKDVIVLSNGKNIHPEEIESHYLASQWIKEICVMGVESAPGEPVSERLHAVIVPDFDALRLQKVVNMREVLRFDIEGLSATMAAPKRILSYDIWQEELPRTTTRKLKRFEIQKRVAQQRKGGGGDSRPAASKPQLEADREWTSQPDVERALKVVQAAAKNGPIHPGDNLELDLGLDSMERVELVVALEQALDAKADENMISEVYTVRELVDAVRAGMGAAGVRVRAGWEQIFATESEDPDVQAIVEERPVASRIWHVLGWFVSFMTHTLFRLKVTGLEKLPKSGSFIIAPNHQSFLDAPILVADLPFPLHKDIFFVGTSEIFGSGPMRRLAHSLKLIPVDPDANLVRAMRAGAFGLKRGKILLMYPEGERSIDGEPKSFKKGAAILAIHHGVPVVPVALEGFHDAWPRGRFFQGFRRLQISIGDPIAPPRNATSVDAAYVQMTAEIRQRVVELWRPLHERNRKAKVATVSVKD